MMWIERGRVALSSLPQSIGEVRRCVENGIKALVLVVKSSERPIYASMLHGVELIVEMVSRELIEEMDLNVLKHASKWVYDRVIRDGKPTLVACETGYTIAPVIVAGYLLCKGLPLDKAIRQVSKKVKPALGLLLFRPLLERYHESIVNVRGVERFK